MMWNSYGKLKAKWVSLNTSIFLSRINPAIKAEKLDPWWPVLQDFWQDFYYFPWSINKCWGWKVVYSKYTIHYLCYLFYVSCKFILCVHWEFIVHKHDQIWHAMAAAEGNHWRSYQIETCFLLPVNLQNFSQLNDGDMVLVLPYVDCFRFSVGYGAICGFDVTGYRVICKVAVMDAPVASHVVCSVIGDCAIRGVSVTAATAAAWEGYHYYNSLFWIIHVHE